MLCSSSLNHTGPVTCRWDADAGTEEDDKDAKKTTKKSRARLPAPALHEKALGRQMRTEKITKTLDTPMIARAAALFAREKQTPGPPILQHAAKRFVVKRQMFSSSGCRVIATY